MVNPTAALRAHPPQAFRRQDESDDNDFYATPRLVYHIDEGACGASWAKVGPIKHWRCPIKPKMFVLSTRCGAGAHKLLPREHQARLGDSRHLLFMGVARVAVGSCGRGRGSGRGCCCGGGGGAVVGVVVAAAAAAVGM